MRIVEKSDEKRYNWEQLHELELRAVKCLLKGIKDTTVPHEKHARKYYIIVTQHL